MFGFLAFSKPKIKTEGYLRRYSDRKLKKPPQCTGFLGNLDKHCALIGQFIETSIESRYFFTYKTFMKIACTIYFQKKTTNQKIGGKAQLFNQKYINNIRHFCSIIHKTLCMYIKCINQSMNEMEKPAASSTCHLCRRQRWRCWPETHRDQTLITKIGLTCNNMINSNGTAG